MKTKLLTWVCPLLLMTLAACDRDKPPAPVASAAQSTMAAPVETAPAQTTAQAEAPAAAPANVQPTESVSETDEPVDSAEQNATVQPSVRLAGSGPSRPMNSERFRDGVHYHKIVPAQPTSVAPGKVEVVEVFWYGCGHCFSLDPAIESWKNKSKAEHVEFVRLPAMWNDVVRMHARLFYTAEALGKLDAIHPLVFRELHVNGNQLNTLEKITAFFARHGVNEADFKKTFSSFAVESKLQRADLLNRRYRVESVPVFIVNGKYRTDLGDAGGESGLFSLIDELAAHEHGG